jgi:hypothetical protein
MKTPIKSKQGKNFKEKSHDWKKGCNDDDFGYGHGGNFYS